MPHYGMAQSIYNYRGYEIVEHGGDLPGQESQVIRVPSEMIGLAVMVNDEQMGTLYHEVVKWMILDELLELESIDWRTRYAARRRVGTEHTLTAWTLLSKQIDQVLRSDQGQRRGRTAWSTQGPEPSLQGVNRYSSRRSVWRYRH